MRITQRQVAIGMQSLLLAGTFAILIYQIITGGDLSAIVTTVVGLMIGGVVLLLFWRDWKYAQYVMIITGVVLSGLIPPDDTLTRETVLSLLIPPVIALILGRPIWIIGSAIGTLLILFIRSGGQGWEASIPVLVILAMIAGGMTLARIVTDNAHHDAREQTRRAEDALSRAEQQAQALAAANIQQETQLDQQRQLLDLVATLETHASPLAEGVLFAPIVGHLDARRAEALTSRLLAEASAQRARLIILDIAGVSTIDTAVARGLLNTAQALRLLGCAVTLSGISAEVAMTLVGLDVGLENVTTARSPREALAAYFVDERRVILDT